MYNIPKKLKFTKTHEWIKIEGSTATFGITDFAQDKLGDVVYVELPQLNSQASQGKELCVVESVKAASDIYAPVSGKISETNTKLESASETLNQSPYEDGWIAKIINFKKEELDNLLTADEYKEFLEKE